MVSISGGFPFPRRPFRGRTNPLDPASGLAPELKKIIAEAATHNPPHPSVLDEAGEEAVRDIVNNPTPANVPLQDAALASANLVRTHGTTGSIPELQDSTIDALADYYRSRLDGYGNRNPTLNRLHANEPPAESIEDLLGMANENATPTYSELLGGRADPSQVPEELSKRIDQLLARGREVRPDAEYGEKAAIRDILGETGGISKDQDIRIEESSLEGESLPVNHIEADLRKLRELTQIKMIKDPEERAAVFARFLRNADIDDTNLQLALLKAVDNARVGGTNNRLLPGDPTAKASLAGSFDPHMLRQTATKSNDGADIDLMMRMLGLDQPRPRRGV